MSGSRKVTIEEDKDELFSFAAFKYSEQISNAIENLEFNNDTALSVNLEECFSLAMKQKQQAKSSNMSPDKNYDCKCMGPTENEIQNALQKYWTAKQKPPPIRKSPSPTKAVEVNKRFLSKPMPSPEQPIKSIQKENISVITRTVTDSKPNHNVKQPVPGFTSAREECLRQAAINNRAPPAGVSATVPTTNIVRRYMGNRLVSSKPNVVVSNDPEKEMKKIMENDGECEDERLKGIDIKLLERIKTDVLAKKSTLTWHDIKGLEFAKETMMEAIVYPIQRPDLFTGLRRPPKGVLMFGPPGTGKTLIAKCVANNANATFFNVSASTLTSKWIGEGEMMVRALFTYARVRQPSVIFIDEVDCLLSQRSDNEHESSRRMKTEFLCFLDGCGTGDDDQVLLIGATNRPGELDEAARRRFTKRLYIPLPETEARLDIIKHYLKEIEHSLDDDDIAYLARATEGFSGADIRVVAENAGFMPMRDLMKSCGAFVELKKEDIPAVTIEHFKRALKGTRPSVSQEDLTHYLEWNKKFGSTRGD